MIFCFSVRVGTRPEKQNSKGEITAQNGACGGQWSYAATAMKKTRIINIILFAVIVPAFC